MGQQLHLNGFEGPVTVSDPVIARGAAVDGLYRWKLWRQWETRKPWVLFVGHNPSTADSALEDPTTRRWQHFAARWGFGGYTAVNLYPYRATDVDDCYAWRAGRGPAFEMEVGIAMDRNLEVIRGEVPKCSRIVVCWGNLAREASVIERTRRALQFPNGSSDPRKLECFGFTKSGFPKHPMARGRSRVPDDFQPVEWIAS